jgi:bifunctional ADP-heptose synthase (sugar kinase/adenylyltransferase)
MQIQITGIQKKLKRILIFFLVASKYIKVNMNVTNQLQGFKKILAHYSSKGNSTIIPSQIIKDLNLNGLIVTNGAEGMSAITANNISYYAPAIPVRVNELSGAGDSVLATLAHSLKAGFDIQQALLNATSIAARFINEGPKYRAKEEDLFFGRENI